MDRVNCAESRQVHTCTLKFGRLLVKKKKKKRENHQENQRATQTIHTESAPLPTSSHRTVSWQVKNQIQVPTRSHNITH